MNTYRRWLAALAATLVAVAGLTGTAAAAPSSQLSGVDTIAAEWLAREDGTSLDEAIRKLATQHASNLLAQRLAAELGERLAGSYLDRVTGGLMVNVTDAATADAVRAAGATPIMVRNTGADLARVNAWLDGESLSGRAGALDSYYVDIVANVVVVNIPAGSDDPDTARVADTVRSFGAAAAIRTAAGELGQTMAENVWAGGTQVWRWLGANKYGCTAGFAAKDAAGNKYMITAAHCVYAAANYLNIGNFKFGNRWYYGLDYDDATVKSATPAYFLQLPNVWHWNNGSVVVKGWFTSMVNSDVCKSGLNSKWTCGYVAGVGIAGTTKFPDGSIRWIYNMTKANLCSRSGDSGGPVVIHAGSFWYATGTISTSNSVSAVQCPANPTTHFQPIGSTLFRSGLSMVTG
jgi:streptogrisin C